MKTEHSLAQLCARLEVTASGYHAWLKAQPSARAQQDAALLAQIQAIHIQHKSRYDAPRIREALAKAGQHHGTKRIAPLMKQAGLRGLCPKRYVPRTTDSHQAQSNAPNRLATAPPPRGPNQIWVSNLTHAATHEGWLYGAVILDLWSRRGWVGAPGRACRPVWCWRPCGGR